MIQTSRAGRIALSGLLTAGLVAAALPAAAGECPAAEVVADSGMQSDAAAKGVTDTVIASLDLAKEGPMLDGRLFRMRRLEIEPGGIVPWHSHGERPAIIFIQSGEIVEHSSTCAVPIVHKAGDVTTEMRTVSHWWENTSDEPVVILSADIFPVQEDPAQM